MSFFDDVLGSIGAGDSSAAPTLPQRPATTVSTIPKTKTEPGKSVPRPAVNSTPAVQNGTKRKAEDDLSKLAGKAVKTSTNPGLTNKDQPRPAKPAAPPPSAPSLSPVTTTSAQTPASKPPPKGSFADIMARARLAQEKNAQNQVGMIKHQAASKEKVSKMAQKRREEDEKAQSQKVKLGKRPERSGRIEKRRSASPVKRRDEPKVAKQPRPPLSAPASGYKGTMGLPARRPLPGANKDRTGRKPSTYDDYLGTDEEDDLEDQEDGDVSDASSDMEAGAFDIDEEESRALRQAREDDAKELALENKLKREKEERRKKLQALADKRR